jgi:DME family drug/metabolite transporter
MACAYLLFGYGLRAIPASTATTLALAQPVVATLLAIYVLNEESTAWSWLGLGLIMAGIRLVALTEKTEEFPLVSGA